MRLRLLALRSQRQASRATPGMAAVEVEAAAASPPADGAEVAMSVRKRKREATSVAAGAANGISEDMASQGGNQQQRAEGHEADGGRTRPLRKRKSKKI